MTARLTAWILAFCIGLPMCWCCADSAPAAAPAEPAGCCAMHQTAEEGATSAPASRHGHCPCLEHEDNRDRPDAAPALPLAVLKAVAAPVWQPLPFQASLSFRPAYSAPRHDHGPPGAARPLYARHCALLL